MRHGRSFPSKALTIRFQILPLPLVFNSLNINQAVNRANTYNRSGRGFFARTYIIRMDLQDDGTPVPTNVIAGCIDEKVGAAKVKLEWESNSVNDSGTQIQRSTDNITFTTIMTTTAGTRIFIDTGLTAAITYYYRIATLGSGSALSYYAPTVAVQTAKGTVGDLFLAFASKVNSLPPQ